MRRIKQVLEPFQSRRAWLVGAAGGGLEVGDCGLEVVVLMGAGEMVGAVPKQGSISSTRVKKLHGKATLSLKPAL